MGLTQMDAVREARTKWIEAYVDGTLSDILGSATKKCAIYVSPHL